MSGEGTDIGSVKRLLRFTGVVVQPGEVLYIFRVKMWIICEIKLEEEQKSHLTRTWDVLSLVVVLIFLLLVLCYCQWTLPVLRCISQQVEYLCGTQYMRIVRYKGSTILGFSLFEGGSRSDFRNVVVFKRNLDDGRSQKRRWCQ